MVSLALAACASTQAVKPAAPAVTPPATSPADTRISLCADDARPGLRAREILDAVHLDAAATPEPARAEALRLNAQGAKLANAGRLDDAMVLHRRALAADPQSMQAVYELAYDHFVRGEPLVTADLLRAMPGAHGPLGYELLGNAYDAAGDETCALLTYRRGLDEFPLSGQLWVEIGLLAQRKNRPAEALDLWERAIVAEPNNASAYLHAGQLLLRSSARVWALLYLETAINLEPGSQRAVRTGTVLERAYRTALSAGSAGLGEYGAVPGDGGAAQASFESLWREAMTAALARTGGRARDALAVTEVRRGFLDCWAALHGRPANPLWERQSALKDAGLWDAYEAWLFRGSRADVWSAFSRANPAAVTALERWMVEHPLRLDDRQHMSRLRFRDDFVRTRSPRKVPPPAAGALNETRRDPSWF